MCICWSPAQEPGSASAVAALAKPGGNAGRARLCTCGRNVLAVASVAPTACPSQDDARGSCCWLCAMPETALRCVSVDGTNVRLNGSGHRDDHLPVVVEPKMAYASDPLGGRGGRITIHVTIPSGRLSG